jgi:tryptophanyl-tRNA synthetase
VFKQYQENGLFLFKLSTPQNKVLLQSRGLADPREAGGWVKRLKTQGAAALDGAPIAWDASADRASVEAALTELVAANL